MKKQQEDTRRGRGRGRGGGGSGGSDRGRHHHNRCKTAPATAPLLVALQPSFPSAAAPVDTGTKQKQQQQVGKTVGAILVHEKDIASATEAARAYGFPHLERIVHDKTMDIVERDDCVVIISGGEERAVFKRLAPSVRVV